MNTELVHYDAMCRAIAQAFKVDEVKNIRDKARAIEVYAKQARNTEAERRACLIRLRAERKWGQLRESEVAPQGRPKTSDDAMFNPPKTLAELGVTPDQSHKWQKLAEVPDDFFEEQLNADEIPTTTGIIRAHETATKPQQPVDDRALWLWGRLKDFDRDGIMNTDPNDLIETMLPHMITTTKQLAPLVIAWLQRINQ